MCGWVDRWVDGLVGGWMRECICVWVNDCVDGWVGGWMFG